MRHHSAEGEAEASPYKVSYLAAAAHTCLPDASGRGDLLPVPDVTEGQMGSLRSHVADLTVAWLPQTETWQCLCKLFASAISFTHARDASHKK